MPAERVPEITLTSPFNVHSAPSNSFHVNRRPASVSRSSFSSVTSGTLTMATGRPESASSRASPGRLLRTLSNSNKAPSSNGQQMPAEVSGPTASSQPRIDPLSRHILQRTNAPLNVLPATVPRPATPDSLAHSDERAANRTSVAPAVQLPTSRTDTANGNAQKDLKKGVKAVSFLSRLIGNKKKDTDDEAVDDGSVISDHRPEGNTVEVFAKPVDNMGYNPRHPQPPGYIKVRSRNKKEREFDRLFLAQELHCTERRGLQRQDSNKLRRKSPAYQEPADTVWAIEFSKDGKYLAAAGADMVVRVWAVLSSSEDRQKHESMESGEANGAGRQAAHLSAPVFQSQPMWEFEGHTSTVLDLSWSKNNFLLSSSMDKTVRLWHASRAECLCTFKHNDFVPSICFHPKDDRFFLAGSLDSKLRLWSIPDKSVAFMAQLPDMITAVAFTPDGKFAVAGCLSGLCMFYETEGLKYQTQIHVRSTRGQNAKGSKITGIQAHHSSSGDIKLLITSNDSRVRLYNFRDKSLEIKFRGLENNCSQIRASINDDGRYVVCGSEDRKAYIWSLGPADGEKGDRRSMEMFEAHNMVTTCVAFAPAKTRQLLSRSEDPVYDLCNPPPVTLMSRAERAESQSSSKTPTENGGIRASTHIDPDGTLEPPKGSQAHLLRGSHNSGNIIVTADFTGRIKVFRQDCAWAKRRPGDQSDRASLFSKRADAGTGGGSRASRAGSVTTKTSQRSLRDSGRTSTSTQAPAERILNWRQGLASTPSVAGSSEGSARTRKEEDSRSISPPKTNGHLSSGRESNLRSATNTSESLASTNAPSTDLPPTDELSSSTALNERSSPKSSASVSTSQSRGRGAYNEDRNLFLATRESTLFWDPERWKGRVARAHSKAPLTPPSDTTATGEDGTGHLPTRDISRASSYVSRLSDECEEFEDARENGDELACSSCGGRDFSARRERGKEGVRLSCDRCGTEVA